MPARLNDDVIDRRPIAWIEASVALILGVVSTFGFSSWYSRALFDRDTFIGQYRSGVYRPRVIGREVVLWVENTIGNPLASRVPPAARESLPGDLFTAMVLVNLAAFLLLAWILHHMVARSSMDLLPRLVTFVSLMTMVAATAYVATPYDNLSLALIAAMLVAATWRPPWDLMAPAFAVVGVATRESQFIAVAALWAIWWVIGRDDRRRVLVAATSTAAALCTYVAVRMASGTGLDGVASAVTLAGNLGRLTGWIGLALSIALATWWRGLCGLIGLGTSARGRRAVAALWVLAIPYVVVAAGSGYWFEARLIIPLLLAECWVRVEVDHAGTR